MTVLKQKQKKIFLSFFYLFSFPPLPRCLRIFIFLYLISLPSLPRYLRISVRKEELNEADSKI